MNIFEIPELFICGGSSVYLFLSSFYCNIVALLLHIGMTTDELLLGHRIVCLSRSSI